MIDISMRQIQLIPMVSCALLCACATHPSPIDAQFGNAVRGAVQSQIVNAHAPTDGAGVIHSDGQSVKSSVDRYQKSFDVVTPTANVYNIGVGSGAGIAP
jgi:hypothetical protein